MTDNQFSNFETYFKSGFKQFFPSNNEVNLTYNIYILSDMVFWLTQEDSPVLHLTLIPLRLELFPLLPNYKTIISQLNNHTEKH